MLSHQCARVFLDRVGERTGGSITLVHSSANQGTTGVIDATRAAPSTQQQFASIVRIAPSCACERIEQRSAHWPMRTACCPLLWVGMLLQSRLQADLARAVPLGFQHIDSVVTRPTLAPCFLHRAHWRPLPERRAVVRRGRFHSRVRRRHGEAFRAAWGVVFLGV